MNPSIFSFLILAILVFFSCGKDSLTKEMDKEAYDELCEWDLSKVSDATIWTAYIEEPMSGESECGCITSGIVKYVKAGEEFAYEVYYGKGECDEYAHLVTYYESGKKFKKCKFKLDCVVGR